MLTRTLRRVTMRAVTSLLCAAMLASTALASTARASAVRASAVRASAAGASAAPRRVAALSRVPHGAAKRLAREVIKAWRITKGQGVTVAVIGGPVDPHAPGLAGKVRIGRAFGNLARSRPLDSTPFASAVVGSGPSQSNPAGTLGLAPAARLLSVRMPATASNRTWFNISADAIRYAARRGAKVIYFSETDYDDEPTLDKAVRYAVSRGAVIVCSNFSFGRHPNDPGTPGSLPGVVTAGTMYLPGAAPPLRKDKESHNDSILVSGPGNTLHVTGPRGASYLIYNSYASAAWVTATVALVKSVYPHLSPALTEQALVLSASDHPRGGYSVRDGYGLINPLGALHEAAKLRKLRQSAPAGPGVVNPTGRLAPGPAPAAIDAVHHPTAKLAGFGGGAVAGLVLLVLAAVMLRRPRRRRAPAVPGTGMPPQPTQYPPPAEPASYAPPAPAAGYAADSTWFGQPQDSPPAWQPPAAPPYGRPADPPYDA